MAFRRFLDNNRDIKDFINERRGSIELLIENLTPEMFPVRPEGSIIDRLEFNLNPQTGRVAFAFRYKLAEGQQSNNRNSFFQRAWDGVYDPSDSDDEPLEDDNINHPSMGKK